MSGIEKEGAKRNEWLHGWSLVGWLVSSLEGATHERTNGYNTSSVFAAIQVMQVFPQVRDRLWTEDGSCRPSDPPSSSVHHRRVCTAHAKESSAKHAD